MSRSSENHLFSPFCLWAAKCSRQKSHHHADWRQHRLVFFNLSWVLNAAQHPLKWSPNSFPFHPAAAVLPEPPCAPCSPEPGRRPGPRSIEKTEAFVGCWLLPLPPSRLGSDLPAPSHVKGQLSLACLLVGLTPLLLLPLISPSPLALFPLPVSSLNSSQPTISASTSLSSPP